MKKLNRKLIAGTAMVATAAALAACGNNTSVYGPPEYFTKEDITIDDINVGPEEDVYGPPQYFDITEDEKEPEPPVYGPPSGDDAPVTPG